MTPESSAPAAPSFATDRFRFLLLGLFVASGCAALVYEIVWFQLLSLIVGSAAISMGLLLAIFMGGMCIGSLGLSRWVTADKHPLRVYAVLEVGIALFGLLILVGLPMAGKLYASIGGPGAVGAVVRGIVCSIFLLPPTILMGATLPAIARWIETTPRGVSWLGFFYGGNTAGAVGGCLLAGFYLLPVHNMAFATYVAMAINLALAGVSFLLSKRTTYIVPSQAPSAGENTLPAGSWPVLTTIALSGLTALGAEVVWTRLLALLLGATTYTFSLILAALLTGLGIGSAIGSSIARSTENPRKALGWCQLLLMGGLAWAAYSTTQTLPYWPINPSLASSARATFEIDLVRCLWAVLPAALLWGASFPLALAALAARQRDPGRVVGVVYAANTLGAIAGALIASLLLIGSIGTQHSQQLLIGLAGVSALLVLALTVSSTGKLTLRPAGASWIVVTIALGIWLSSFVIPVPGVLVAYGRNTMTWGPSHGEFIFVGEGISSSMAVSRLSNGVLNYHNAGKTQASSEPQDMRLQRMLGHLTTLIPEHPRSVLVIGCGAGVTAGAVSIDPAVERETIAEIEPLVPKVVSRYFGEHNFQVVDNPKVHVHVDDARHFLLTTKEKFDAITSDPFDPWVKGAATLYTKEFFEAAKQHLNPGGVVTVFVQLYESGEAAVKSEVATFMEVFPNGMIFSNTIGSQGYDTVMVGQVEPSRFDMDKIEARLAKPEYAAMRQSLAEIGFHSATELFATFTSRAVDLKPWLADAQINYDRNLRLQFLAGRGLNMYDQDPIYQNMAKSRHWPEGLFTASPERMEALRAAFETAWH